MSTSLHKIFNLVAGNVYVSYLILLFLVEKRDFLQVLKTPIPKNRFLVSLRSFFSTYKFFPGWGVVISF